VCECESERERGGECERERGERRGERIKPIDTHSEKVCVDQRDRKIQRVRDTERRVRSEAVVPGSVFGQSPVPVMPPQVAEHLEGDEAAPSSLLQSPSSLLQSPSSLLECSVWIFGYGSLIWKPDFEFSCRKIGFIRGYSRRFWHGDSYHRGNQETVGEVY